MSRYRATVTVDCAPGGDDDNNSSSADAAIIQAICDSVKTDELFYPDNPVKTKVVGGGGGGGGDSGSDGGDDDDDDDGSSSSSNSRLVITSESDNLAHIRANLNSTLRLVQASYASIAKSVSQQDA